MAFTSADILEMPEDPSVGAMPHFPHIRSWLQAEVRGLTDDELDFDDLHPDREWMWWSIRRQVSHIAWDTLVLPWRRCGHLLWAEGEAPNLEEFGVERLGPNRRWDRVLDEDRFWTVADLMAQVDVGLAWLERAVTENSIETLRATSKSVRATHFWAYVITVLPRGAKPDPDEADSILYDLEGTLWMGFYEAMAHVRTIQRLKIAQGLDPVATLDRVGYLRLPEYWGETDANGPSMERIRSS